MVEQRIDVREVLRPALGIVADRHERARHEAAERAGPERRNEIARVLEQQRDLHAGPIAARAQAAQDAARLVEQFGIRDEGALVFGFGGDEAHARMRMQPCGPQQQVDDVWRRSGAQCVFAIAR